MSLLAKINTCIDKKIQRINKYETEVKELSKLREQVGGAETQTELEKLMSTHNTELDNYGRKVSNVETKVNELNKNITDIFGKLNLITTLINKLIKDRNDCKENNAGSKIQAAVLRAQKKKLDDDKKRIDDALRAQGNRSEEEKALLRAQSRDMARQLEEVNQSLNNTNVKCAGLDKQIEEKEKTIQKLEENYKKLETQVKEHLQNTISKLQEHNKRLENIKYSSNIEETTEKINRTLIENALDLKVVKATRESLDGSVSSVDGSVSSVDGSVSSVDSARRSS